MADTLRLKYGFTAKPVLADRDGEVDTNWVDGGTHVVTADATHAHAGTKSFKVAASGTGDFTTNYGSLASGNNATFTVGNQYCVSIWLYAASALTAQLKTGGVESSTLTCVTDTWTAFHFTFTCLTATTAFQIAVTTGGGGNIWFELEPFAEYVELTVLGERGMSDPDSVGFWPQIQNTYLDGSMDEGIKGFRRKIWLDVGVVAAAADRKRILYWMIDNDRTVDYLTEVNVPLALQDIGGYENEWKFDCSLLRYFTFSLQEPSIRTTFPV